MRLTKNARREHQLRAIDTLKRKLMPASTITIIQLGVAPDKNGNYWRKYRVLAIGWLNHETPYINGITSEVRNALDLRHSQAPIFCIRTTDEPSNLTEHLGRVLFGDRNKLEFDTL